MCTSVETKDENLLTFAVKDCEAGESFKEKSLVVLKTRERGGSLGRGGGLRPASATAKRRSPLLIKLRREPIKEVSVSIMIAIGGAVGSIRCLVPFQLLNIKVTRVGCG